MTQPSPRKLYPPIEPYETGRLAVSARHSLRFERCGRPGGVPAVVLHGGPGSGSNPGLRRYFDPALYDVMVFDQRGCGGSTPLGEVRDNDTWALVADIEALRERAGVERWLVFGGSWGSTLALAYAQSHPERVTGLVMRGIFTGAAAELDWLYRTGAPRLLPDAFEDFKHPIPAAERGDLLSAYHARIHGEDPAAARNCARAWALWELRASALEVDRDRLIAAEDPDHAGPIAAIETHYFVNGCFFDDTTHPLAPERVKRIAHIPITIAHGRYDLVTPPSTAWALKRAAPHARLEFAPTAGHAASEPGLVDALVRATDAFVKKAD